MYKHYSGAPPYTEADCKDACQLTYCEACYYHPGPDPLPPPPGCADPSTDDDNCNGCICCLKEWARCVEPRNERDNPVSITLFQFNTISLSFIITQCTGDDCQTAGNFKCYAYPPCNWFVYSQPHTLSVWTNLNISIWTVININIHFRN